MRTVFWGRGSEGNRMRLASNVNSTISTVYALVYNRICLIMYNMADTHYTMSVTQVLL